MGKDEGRVNPNFMARVTQHISEKGFQIVRYYGWYSNRVKGRRRKEGMLIGNKGVTPFFSRKIF